LLEYDQGSEKQDKYQRLLAWVFVDGVLLQNELVKEGLAEVTYLYGNYKWTPTLQDSEALAKAQKLKIWGDFPEEVSSPKNEEVQEPKEPSKENSSPVYYYLGGLFLVFGCTVFGVSQKKQKKLLKQYKKLK